MSERNFDDFDDYATDYREIHSKNIRISGVDSRYFASMKVQLLKDHETDKISKLLDVGCGDGTTEEYFQYFFPGWLVTGIDISQKSIQIAKEKGIENSKFLIYNGKEIPLPNESVDIIFMAGVLHHVSFEFHSILLAEVYRVLKKGGRFYLFEHNPKNPLTKYLVQTCVFDKDAKLLQHTYTDKILTEAGFLQKKIKFIIFFPRNLIFKPLLFLEKYLKKIPFGGQYFFRAIK